MDAVIVMEISIADFIELQAAAEQRGATRERDGIDLTRTIREQQASHDKRIVALKHEHDKALHAVIARHLDEIATCGEKSFKVGAEQGRSDGLRDCWHVVASILQEAAKRHDLIPVREILENVAKMAREGTIADVLDSPAEPTPHAN